MLSCCWLSEYRLILKKTKNTTNPTTSKMKSYFQKVLKTQK